MVPSRVQTDGSLQPSETTCAFGSHPQAGLNFELGELSDLGCVQEILLSGQIGPNEYPFHSHAPFTLYNPEQVGLDPELSSAKGHGMILLIKMTLRTQERLVLDVGIQDTAGKTGGSFTF